MLHRKQHRKSTICLRRPFLSADAIMIYTSMDPQESRIMKENMLRDVERPLYRKDIFYGFVKQFQPFYFLH